MPPCEAGGAKTATGSMTLHINTDNRIQADVVFYDYAINDRRWIYKMRHNGSLSVPETIKYGSFSITNYPTLTAFFLFRAKSAKC